MRMRTVPWITTLVLGVSLAATAEDKIPANNGGAGKEAQNPPKAAAETETATKTEKNDKPRVDDADSMSASPDEQAIRQVVRQIETAFNEHDLEKLAAAFSDHAEVIGTGGEVSSGREEIRKIFQDVFESSPEVQMSIQIESIRVLGPTVAIEEGMTRIVHAPGDDEQLARYAVIYTKEGGAWKMISARDIPVEAAVDDHLRQLEWLVGDWIDECDDAVVRTSYRWSQNQRFLIGEFEVATPSGEVMHGSTHIGWDPQLRQIRSWIFDSEGGYASGLWARNEDTWIVKLTGVLADGRATTATHRFTRLSTDHAELQSTDRVIGGVLIDDGEPVSVVRQGPKPQSISRADQPAQP